MRKISVVWKMIYWFRVSLVSNKICGINLKNLQGIDSCNSLHSPDFNGTQSYNHLVRKRTLNHFGQSGQFGYGFESRYSHLNFRFRPCFEQGVPSHSDNYRVWIHSETRTWHDENIINRFTCLEFFSNWIISEISRRITFMILLTTNSNKLLNS